jgi:hypothetical protein
MLEKVVIEARDAAEVGARAALEALAVHHHEPYPHMKPAHRELRNHLRARARQLGDRQDASGRLAIDHLGGECAYEHWHRMLFARFLAENSLLIEPDEQVAISLGEAEELAKGDGLEVWDFASRCAQRMLPQIFRPDDPLLQVAFATEHRLALERLLASLPVVIFTASDALGWVYQFWQSKRKDDVNRSEVKIGADEISAVTQLFTEPYMVEFLLHNTLGAWWAGKNLPMDFAATAATEDELRAKVALPHVAWEYLRFTRDPDSRDGPWRPAAGSFTGWPKAAADLRVLDPCCGSGHFLVAALHCLVPIRMAEEGLSELAAVDAVLSDNLHGLEIDERCCQIAAFALALAAWTYPSAGGYRSLPEMHIACTGIAPQTSHEQWVQLAARSRLLTPHIGREAIRNGLLNLHQLFSQAPTLGSLLDPSRLPPTLLAADFNTIRPCLSALLNDPHSDEDSRERAIAASGMLDASTLLATKFTLVITNVPYLGRNKHSTLMAEYCSLAHPEAKADLATCFIERSLTFCAQGGSIAIVAPQNWLFLTGYRAFRETILRSSTVNGIARLEDHAFQMISGGVVRVVLGILTRAIPSDDHAFLGLDASSPQDTQLKADLLQHGPVLAVEQSRQRANPDARISLTVGSVAPLLSTIADASHGQGTFDSLRFTLLYWEIGTTNGGWVLQQSTPAETRLFGGCHYVLRWEDGVGQLAEMMARKEETGYSSGKWKAGVAQWGKAGVMIGQMRDLPSCLYLGAAFDENASAVVPSDLSTLPAIWSYCEAGQFAREARAIDQSLKITCKTLVKVPFDLVHWTKVAAERYPHGLPEPESDDPTQWLFHGSPGDSTAPLQVAVARLVGIRWPAELDASIHLSKRARALVERCRDLASLADTDGIVCIPSVRGEEPAPDRLERLLDVAGVTPTTVREFTGGSDLAGWLRNLFFAEHCKLFHDRPFVWHVWDGRKQDGFHALVNYHRLCEGGGGGRRLLESLTYAYLGEWVARQKDGVKRGEAGAEDRLAAAVELQKRLEAILAGEPPFDIFVRWKPLHQQPMGWEPDINDGVRVNIRPFLADDLPGGRSGAGILRWNPNIKWTKDRGKEPERPKAEYPWFWGWDEKTEDFAGGKTFDGNRWNDCHYSNRAKQQARDGAAAKPRKR